MRLKKKLKQVLSTSLVFLLERKFVLITFARTESKVTLDIALIVY